MFLLHTLIENCTSTETFTVGSRMKEVFNLVNVVFRKSTVFICLVSLNDLPIYPIFVYWNLKDSSVVSTFVIAIESVICTNVICLCSRANHRNIYFVSQENI